MKLYYARKAKAEDRVTISVDREAYEHLMDALILGSPWLCGLIEEVVHSHE